MFSQLECCCNHSCNTRHTLF